MQKIKEIYKGTVEYLKNFNFGSINKKYIGTGALVLVVAVVGIQLFSIQSKTDKTELAIILDSAVEQLEAAKENKTQYIEKKIYQADYNKKEAEIEVRAEEIVEKLHLIKLRDEVKVQKETLEDIGNSLQLLLYVIHNSPSLKDINDEILAFSIIVEEIKEQI